MSSFNSIPPVLDRVIVSFLGENSKDTSLTSHLNRALKSRAAALLSLARTCKRFGAIIQPILDALSLQVKNNVQSLEKLIAAKPKMPSTGRVLWAVMCPNADDLRTILLNGGDPNEQDMHGRTALHITVETDDKKCVEVLLEHSEINLALTTQIQQRTAKAEAKKRNREQIYKMIERIESTRIQRSE